MKMLTEPAKARLRILLDRLVYTFANLSLHGLNFLVRPSVHWTYRLIHFVIIINVNYMVVHNIITSYNNFIENTVRFTIQTNYLNWNATFPAISVCEILNVDKIYTLSQSIYGESSEKELDKYLGEIAFFPGICRSCGICNSESECPTGFDEIVEVYRDPCRKLFYICKWKDAVIDCCEYFRPLQTEYGTCFTVNSKLTGATKPPLISNAQIGLGTMDIIVSQDYELFLHSPEDVPFWNAELDRRLTVLYGSEVNILFTMMETVNDPEVTLVSPNARNCRFDYELPDNYHVYDVYSFSGCIVQCRIDAQLRLCNCTHHLMPTKYEDSYCDLDGLKCLTDNFDRLRKPMVPGEDDDGLNCECLPSCTEAEYNIVVAQVTEPDEDVDSNVARFSLHSRPYVRTTRQVARTTLDFVVSVGNSIGLCLGGSLLSVVEIMYYLCWKRWKYNQQSVAEIYKKEPPLSVISRPNL